MLPVLNQGAGGNVGPVDPCATPAGIVVIVIPYPNFAMHAMALMPVYTVFVSGLFALNLGSFIFLTSGDEAGVAHPTIKGAGRFTLGVIFIIIGSLPALTLTALANGNNFNCPLALAILPPVCNVLIARAPDGPTGLAPRALAAELACEGDISPIASHRAAPDVLWLTIRWFSGDAAARVQTALDQVREGDGVVLDLRDCPGGELEGAIRLAQDFLDDGAIAARGVDADGDEWTIFKRGARAHRMRAVVVVDRATASAAEVFASALQASGRAAIVGERTYGKGRSHRVVEGEGGDLALRSDAENLAAGGARIEGVGLEPDVCVAARDVEAVAIARVSAANGSPAN